MSKRTTISVVIITLNEERNIERCMLSVKDWTDEIIIADSGSQDKTVEIANRLGAKVISLEWNGYSKTKNAANLHARCDYILSLDADEEISEELKASILRVLKEPIYLAYSMNRLTQYCGKWIKHSGWYPDNKLRLFPKGSAEWHGDFVHERLVLNTGISSASLNGAILHYSYYTKQEHLDRERKYAKLAAQRDAANQKKGSLIRGFFKALGRFIRMYFFKLGFLDGPLGFQLCLISAKGKIWREQYNQ